MKQLPFALLLAWAALLLWSLRVGAIVYPMEITGEITQRAPATNTLTLRIDGTEETFLLTPETKFSGRKDLPISPKEFRRGDQVVIEYDNVGAGPRALKVRKTDE